MERGQIHNSTAEINLRLSNVEELSSPNIMRDTIAPVLKAALANVLKAPTLTRISLHLFTINKVPKLNHIAIYSDLTDWFQHESCLFEPCSTLRYFGANLRELHLQSSQSSPAFEAASNRPCPQTVQSLPTGYVHVYSLGQLPLGASLELESEQVYTEATKSSSVWTIAHWDRVEDTLLEKPQFSSVEIMTIMSVDWYISAVWREPRRY
ncbi:hypothetical protein BT96DRAFT_1010905 [Gymnopus androsaceus JB14]|uniref:Uncharacterized protein n=1 Tax=Gymnopus androsaceus JB14 TaxID=1447944 RepID=A0A6A4G9Z9_9AGAR|nr:hypothetical protein BT96DRAFT_1010905 [Gymnopus androsaceus JB14]